MPWTSPRLNKPEVQPCHRLPAARRRYRGYRRHRALVTELEAGRDAQFPVQEIAVLLEPPPRLGPVALSDMSSDEGTLRALPERVGGHGEHRSLGGLIGPSGLDEPVAQRLDAVQHSRADPLAR